MLFLNDSLCRCICVSAHEYNAYLYMCSLYAYMYVCAYNMYVCLCGYYRMYSKMLGQ